MTFRRVSSRNSPFTSRAIDIESPNGTSTPRWSLSNSAACQYGVESTPYWHAAELLSDQRGVLVPFGDSMSIAREVNGLLRDETRRNVMSDNAYRLGRKMVWSNTAGLYMNSFEQPRRRGTASVRELAPTSGFVHAA